MSSTNDRTGSNGRGRPASDKLAELERRYVRKDSPSPESGGVRIELPGAKLSLKPERVKRAFPWVLAGLGFFGFSGATLAGYWHAFNAGHVEQARQGERIRQLEDELATLKAAQVSQARRLRTLETAEGAPMVVRP